MRRVCAPCRLLIVLWPCVACAAAPLVRIDKRPAPVIDGSLADAGWRACAQLLPFIEAEGTGTASVQTRAFVYYSDIGLHVAFRCDEPRMTDLVANSTERDIGVWRDDCVELFVMRPGEQGFRQVIVNSIGTTYESKDRNANWNPLLEAQAFREDAAWGVELTLRWGDLGGAPAPGDVWRANFCRERKVEDELSCWACTYGKFFNTHRFGEIVFGESTVRMENVELATAVPGANTARLSVVVPANAAATLSAAGGQSVRTPAGGGTIELLYPVGLSTAETVFAAEVDGETVWRQTVPVQISPPPRLDALRSALGALSGVKTKLSADSPLFESLRDALTQGEEAAAALENAVAGSVAEGRPLDADAYSRLNAAVASRAAELSTMQWPVWTKNSWLDVDRHELPPSMTSIAELSFTSCVNEFESGNVIISNLSDRTLRLRITTDSASWVSATDVPGENVVRNAGFEGGIGANGAPADWLRTGGPAGSIRVTPEDGHGNVLVVDRTGSSKRLALRQTLELQSGKRYACQFWARTEDLAGELRAMVINKGWTWSAGSRHIVGTHGWRRFAFSFTAPESDYHQLIVWGNDGGRGNVWLDDFAMVEGTSTSTVFDGATPGLAVADWQELRGGQVVADPLVPLNAAGRLDLPAGESRQVWITLPARDLPPGQYEWTLLAEPLATLALKGSAPSKSVTLRLDVRPLRIATSPDFAVYNWDYAKSEADVRNLYEHKVNFFLHGTRMPLPVFDSDGNASGDTDYSGYDRMLRIKMKYARKAGGQILFAYGIIRDFHRGIAKRQKWEFRSPAWDRAFRYAYTHWLDHLKGLGLRYDEYSVQVWDEATHANVDYVVEGGKLLRELDPNVRLTMDGAQSLAEVKRMDPYIDVWVPHLTTLGTAKDRVELLQYYLQTGEPVYSYTCSTFMKARPAYSYHRRKPWIAASYGVQGTFYWAYNSWRGDPWNDFDGPIADCGVIYPGAGTPIDSRRWEASREGIEDWQIIRLLEGFASAAGHSGQPARELIRRAIKDVVAAPEQVDQAQAYRLELIQAAEELAQKTPLQITTSTDASKADRLLVRFGTSAPASGRLLYRVSGTAAWGSADVPTGTDHAVSVKLPPMVGADWIVVVWDTQGRVAHLRKPSSVH